MLFFEKRAVRLHGRLHLGKTGKRLGKMLLYEQIDRMAASGDDDVLRPLVCHAVIFVFHHGRADGSLLRIGKSKLHERFAHTRNADALVVCGKRGRQTYIYGRVAREQRLRR